MGVGVGFGFRFRFRLGMPTGGLSSIGDGTWWLAWMVRVRVGSILNGPILRVRVRVRVRRLARRSG